MLSVPLVSLHNIRSCAIGFGGLHAFAILSIIYQQGLPKQIRRSERAYASFLSISWEEDFFSLKYTYFLNVSFLLFAIASHLQDIPIPRSKLEKSLCIMLIKHEISSWIESCKVLFIHKCDHLIHRWSFQFSGQWTKELKTLRIWYILKDHVLAW